MLTVKRPSASYRHEGSDMSKRSWCLGLGAAFGVSLPFVEKVSTSPGGQAGARLLSPERS